jgi:hypothetical protein
VFIFTAGAETTAAFIGASADFGALNTQHIYPKPINTTQMMMIRRVFMVTNYPLEF